MKKTLRIIISVLILTIIGYLAYSTWIYQKSNIEQEGITVCEGEVCKWSAHWHAQLKINICGKNYPLPIENGDLDGPHHHKEQNIIHWHSTLNADPKTKLPNDKTQFTLESFFKQMNLRFDSQCFADQCSCNGTGKLTMTVNGKNSEDYEKYIWKDGDQITITMR